MPFLILVFQFLLSLGLFYSMCISKIIHMLIIQMILCPSYLEKGYDKNQWACMLLYSSLFIILVVTCPCITAKRCLFQWYSWLFFLSLICLIFDMFNFTWGTAIITCHKVMPKNLLKHDNICSKLQWLYEGKSYL